MSPLRVFSPLEELKDSLLEKRSQAHTHTLLSEELCLLPFQLDELCKP